MSEAIPERPERDIALLAEGEAALRLSESLILALMEARVLDTETMLEAIEIEIAAKQAENAEATGRDPRVSRGGGAAGDDRQQHCRGQSGRPCGSSVPQAARRRETFGLGPSGRSRAIRCPCQPMLPTRAGTRASVAPSRQTLGIRLFRKIYGPE